MRRDRHLLYGLTALLICLVCAAPAWAQQDPLDPPGTAGSSGLLVSPPCDRISICTGASLANGQAYAGDGLIWQTNFNARAVQLIDTNQDCEVLRSCSVPSGSPSENAYDGEFVYHYNFSTGLVYKIDEDTCEIVSSCNAPGNDLAEGLTFRDGYLWKADSSTLYQFTPPPECAIVSSCPSPGSSSGDGLATCGEFLLMLKYSGDLVQIDPATCGEVSTCSLNAGAAGNGISADGIARLFADQPNQIDVVDADCGVSFESPQFSNSPCGDTISIEADTPGSFNVTASDLDQADMVTLDVAGLPPGATMTPPLPAQGNPVSSMFNWTPTEADAGTHVITFIATDLQGNVTECVVTIEVERPLLVDLTYFRAKPDNGRVMLEWETHLEIDNAGFYVIRRNVITGEITRVNQGLIAAMGDVFSGARYEAEDTTAVNGVEYEYVLVDVELTGLETRHPGASAVPNPLNPRVHLVAPAYGATVAPSSRPKFTWDADTFTRLTLLVSADPSFASEAGTLGFATHRGRKSGQFTPSPRAARHMEALAARNLGVLYWKLVESTMGPQVDASATHRLDYQAVAIAEPEPEIRKKRRADRRPNRDVSARR